MPPGVNPALRHDGAGMRTFMRDCIDLVVFADKADGFAGDFDVEEVVRGEVGEWEMVPGDAHG